MVVLLLGISVQQSYGYIPSRQAKFITFSNVNSNEMTVNWVRGNGQNVIVLVDDAAIDVSGLGEDEATASAFANMSGSDYNGTAAKLVYQGTGTQVTVTGLTANTTYHVMVLEYNVDGSNWDINNDDAVLNPREKKTLVGTLGLPTGMSTVALTATTATVAWTVNGSLAVGYYIDVRLSNGAILEAYDLLDIGLPGTKKFYITGLGANTGYQWRLRPYDAQDRVGAPTAWQNFSTLNLDPSVSITGATSICGGEGYLVATWQLGTSTSATYYPSPAEGTWTALSGPTGAGAPGITPNAIPGSSTGNITVDKAGEYVFQFEIGVGEYYRSSTAGYTFRAPTTTILTSATSTCGTYVALSANSSGCATTGTWSYTGPTGGTGSFVDDEAGSTAFNLYGTPTPVYGDYSFTWTSSYLGLSSYDDITITFSEAATASVTTASLGYCGLTYTLDGNTPVTNGSGSWWQVSGTGTASFVDATSNTSSVSVDQAGYYSFIWQVSNTCATVGATKHVTFYAPPDISNAGTDAENCGLTYTLAGNDPTTGTGVWSGPAGVTFGNSGTYNSSVTIPTFSGNFTYHSFTWTVDNGLCDANIDDVTVTFYNQPTATVGTSTESICGLSIQLDAYEEDYGTGSWTISNVPTGYPNSGAPTPNPGTVSFNDATVYNTNAYVSVQGLYNFVWTVTNGTCTDGASKQVYFYHEPTSAEAGTDAENCGLTYTMNGNTPSYGVGTWSQVAGLGNSTFTTPTSPTTDVTIPTFGTDYTSYTFRWSIGNGVCTPETDDVVVTFYNQPTTASAGDDVDVCGSLSNTFDANLPTYGVGSWSLVSGAGTVSYDEETLYSSEFDVNMYGSYTFRWTISNGTCTSSTDDVVFNFFEDVNAIAGDNTAICGNEYTLAATEQTAGTGTWTGAAGVNFTNANMYNTTVTVPSIIGASTYYTFTWAVSNGSCKVEYDEVTVTFKQAPDAYAGTNGEVCEDVAYAMTGTWATPGQTGTWSHTYTGVSISFDNVNSPISDVTIDTPGTYEFTWTADNGTCTDTDVVSVKVYLNEEPNAGTDFATCGLADKDLNATEPTGTGTWSVPTGITINDANAYDTEVTANTFGVYTMTWAVKNGPCDVNYDYVTVTFKAEVNANAGNTGTGCTGASNYYTMNGSLISGETGTWSQVSGPINGTASFSNVNSEESLVYFTTPGQYVFNWLVSNGTCDDDDDVTITVYDPINIPLGAAISGDETPAGGTSNIQYSIPNYNDELTYTWWYTPTESSCSTVPVIYDGTENVVYLDYPLSACDGTLSVSLIDKCLKVSTYHLPIDVQNIPVITKAELTNNTTLEVTTNLAIYTNCSSGAIVPSDFQLFFTKNAGTATGASITGISGSNPYTFTIAVTGTPNGCETIEIKPVNGAVWSLGDPCEVMLNDQTTGEISLWNMTTTSVATAIDPEAYARRANIAWTAPSGAKSLVVVNTTNVFNDPTNYTSYPANASYGTQTYTPGTGYTVYNGADNVVEVTGLSPATTYYVGVWTYTEACGIENEYYNMTQTTASFGTGQQATKLVFVNPPTKIASGTQFTITVKATLNDGTTAAFPGCDEELGVHGSMPIATGTIHYNEKEVTMTGLYSDSEGDCDKVFTVEGDNDCDYTLTPGTFTADVTPAEPSTHAKTLSFTNVQKNQLTVSWAYNGDGTGRVLGVKKGATIPLSDFVDGENFSMVTTSTTATFGQGKELPSSSGTNPAWAVHRTTGIDGVTVTGLAAGQSYNFRVVEYKKPVCDTDWSLANFKNSGTGVLNPRSYSTLSKLGSFNGVEIAYFDGKSYQLQVDLNWEAITEDGIAYYDIYRQDMYSEDMIKVGSSNVNVSAGAGSKYTLTDNKGLALGETYIYRLVAVDFNGQSTDLAETLVTVNDDVNRNINLTIGSVNPNPVKDVVRFDVSTTQLSPVYIEIRNVEGKVIYTEERMVNGVSTVEYKMNVKAAGSYFITVTSGDEGAVTTFIYQP